MMFKNSHNGSILKAESNRYTFIKNFSRSVALYIDWIHMKTPHVYGLEDTPDPVKLRGAAQGQAEQLVDSLYRSPELDRLWREGNAIAEQLRKPHVAYASLLEFADSVNALVVPLAACRHGCSHCCNMAVTITNIEAGIIARTLKIEKASPDMRMAISRDAMVAKWSGVPCPFLSGGKCTIYATRPWACRSLMNMSQQPQVCDIATYPGMDVPALDMGDFDKLYASVLVNHVTEIADIRDFFPHYAEVAHATRP